MDDSGKRLGTRQVSLFLFFILGSLDHARRLDIFRSGVEVFSSFVISVHDPKNKQKTIHIKSRDDPLLVFTFLLNLAVLVYSCWLFALLAAGYIGKTESQSYTFFIIIWGRKRLHCVINLPCCGWKERDFVSQFQFLRYGNKHLP